MIQFKLKKVVLAAVAMLLFTSCASKHVPYFQDLDSTKTMIPMTAAQEITLKPGDKVSIVISGKDPELAAILNLPIVSQRAGYASDVITTGTQQQVSAYTLDGEGNIDFPQVGKINLKGLNREAVESLIKEKIINAKLMQDPTVIVEYMNMHINVLGEVKTPGRITISDDHVTLYDILAKAGDLTVNGRRDNVRLLRTVGDQQQVYTFNLTNDSATINNPAYYLQQNDVVYVTPNKKKTRESTVNGNNVLSASFWISVSSLAATVTSIAITATK